MTKVLLTGATGFAGSYLVEKLLAETDWDIYCIERLTPRANKLGALSFSPRVHHLYHDFRSELPEYMLQMLAGCDYIIHMGAEVHGMRSLQDPELFVKTNVLGTLNLLEAARLLQPKCFIYISSAEAVGSAHAPESLAEDTVLNPSNPYAAAKAAGEMLTQTYARSFGVPAMIVRTMNIFGERQGIDKFIPGVIKKMLDGTVINVHVGPDGKSGSRHWLHIQEFTNAVFFLMKYGTVGETYHIVGPEKSNENVISIIGLALGVPFRMHPEVPGRSHDMRYSIKDTKLSTDAYQTGDFEANLVRTTLWYKANREWLR